jgi:plasmid maintenance system antidote protein VapI
MMTVKWDPDWVISPGEILREWMQENGFVLGTRLLLKPVATACGRMDPERLQKILDGKVKLRKDDAQRLWAGTGIPASLWLNLERAFRQGLAKGKTWNP